MNKKLVGRVTTLFILMSFVVFTILSKQFAAQLAPSGQWDNWNSSNQGILIDSMQSGWSAAYRNNVEMLNKTNYVEGSGSIELSILPSSNNNFAGAITKSVNINLDNASNFYFWFYIQNASSLMGEGNYGVILFLSNGANYKNYFQCGIISGGIQNGWNPIVIARSACQAVGSPSWTNNITSMEFRVALNNSASYTNNIITNFDNFRYNYGGGVFNKAQVILTFDGSWNSTLYNATPILQSNDQSAVAFIVTNQINEGKNGGCGSGKCITSTEITQLYSDGWDISSHTVDHANLAPNTTANIMYQLAKSVSTLKALGIGNSVQFFAYPNGAYNNQVISDIELQNNYTLARAEGYGLTQPNLFAYSPYNLSYRIQSIAITPSVTPTMIENYINQVEAEKGLLVLTFHIIQPNPCKSIRGYATLGECLNNSVEYSTANFTSISNYLRQEQFEGELQVTNFSAYSAAINFQTSTSTTTIPTTTTTITLTTSTTTSTSTTTIPSSCSGVPSLTLGPNPVGASSNVNAIVSGISNCNGVAITIKDYQGCTSGAVIATFVDNTTNNGSILFKSPASNGQYGYYACINGESSTKAVLTISTVTTTTSSTTSSSTTTIPENSTTSTTTTTISPSSPTIILPASVLPSSSSGLVPIAVSGTGFTPGDLVNFGYIPIPPYTNALIAPIANSNGSWSGTFSAPWSAGSYNVIAVDASGVSATATLVVT